MNDKVNDNEEEGGEGGDSATTAGGKGDRCLAKNVFLTSFSGKHTGYAQVNSRARKG